MLKYASQASKFQKILKDRKKKAGNMKKRHGAKEEADKEGRKKGSIGIQLQLAEMRREAEAEGKEAIEEGPQIATAYRKVVTMEY